MNVFVGLRLKTPSTVPFRILRDRDKVQPGQLL
jgi:hypothetical protein